VQQRLDTNPNAVRQRRETVEHPFGTIKAQMGATHFLTKTLPKVAAEMALHVLAYNRTRVMNLIGINPEPVPVTSGHHPRRRFYTTKARLGHQAFSSSVVRHRRCAEEADIAGGV
jgi:hypothetical protein